MAETITPFPKEAQTRRRGKPKVEAPAPEPEATVMSEAAARVATKRAARMAAPKDDIVGEAIFAGTQVELSLDRIEELRNPRVLASEAEQKALNDSVKMHGVLQPILVRPLDATGTKFAIVAGHRRFTAAKTAHLKSIPAVVKVVDETNAFVQSLVENLQREDLNPLDEAKALQQLLEETGQTQEELGKRLGKRQSTISNSLRLLTLAEPVKAAIEDGSLSASHGKAIAALPEKQQIEVAQAAVAQKLPSRDVEDRIRKAKEDAKRTEEVRIRKEAEVAKAIDVLTAFLAEHPDRKPEEFTILVHGYGNGHVIAALQAAGVQARDEKTGDRQTPEYSCAEQLVTFTYLDWKGALNPTCTENDHHVAFVKERDHEKNEKAKKVAAKLDRTKTLVMSKVRSEEGKGILNIDGQRLALYQLLMSSRGYSGNGSKWEAFVKRHGGPANEVKTPLAMDVVEAIAGLTEKDLGQELAQAAVNGLFVNLWGENANSHSGSEDWAMRAYLVEQFGLDADLVWGESKVPFQVLDAKKARGQVLTEAEAAEVDRVLSERNAWKSKWDGPTTEATTATDESTDGDAEEEGEVDGDSEE
ncbi:MAG: ParB/RepB/Spo0J family partition protein [Limnohabitans sp.]